MNDSNKFSKLTDKEMEILETLWRTEKPLLASEIVCINNDLKIATVYPALKRLLKKNLIEVVDIVQNTTGFGRKYRPTMNCKEFELKKIIEEFKMKDISTSNLVAALLAEENNKDILEELEHIECMLKEIRANLLEDNIK